MDFRIASLGAVIVLAAICCGCNSSSMPEGPTAAQVKEKVNAMPPQQQIDMYKNSPMSKEEKAAKIAEIEQKYGIKDSGGSAGAPGGPPPAAAGK